MRIKTSYIVAAGIALALAGWIASGQLFDAKQAAPSARAQDEDTGGADPIAVRVRVVRAQERQTAITLTGRSEALARVELKAQTPASVLSLPLAEGAAVKTGDLVCAMDKGARQARLLQTQAALEQASADYDAGTSLSRNGYTAETRVRALKAQMDAARAAVADAELDLQRTRIVAPFDGVVERHNADIGAYLGIGAPCVTLTARDPMLIVAQVSEREVALLREGMRGDARLATGQEVSGVLRLIAPSADPETRTFRIELAVANGDGALRDGVTAQLSLTLPPIRAHRLSTSYLALNEAGDIGVKTISADNKVAFMPVSIVSDEIDAVWVAGLPEETNVITAGQDYVVAGQTVKPVPDTREQI